MKTGMAIAAGVAAAMLAGVGVARAQLVFSDTFSGRQLLPHWQQPPSEHWEHTVGGGRLTVTDLFHPGVPGEPNTATIGAEFPVSDVNFHVLTTLLNWAPGEGRTLTVRLWGRSEPVAIGYDESGPEPVIFLEVPGAIEPFITAPAPGPGTHEFRLVDYGGDGLRLYVDDVFRIGNGGDLTRLRRVDVVFAGTEGVQFSPLSVGRVSIVPSPGTFLALASGVGIMAARRRRSWPARGKHGGGSDPVMRDQPSSPSI